MAEQAAVRTAENEIAGISLEDCLLAVEIVKKALSYRPFIKEGIFGERYLELSEEQKREEFLTPRIGIFYPDAGRLMPAIFLRIMGTEAPLTETFFYPVEAAWSFLDEGRDYLSRTRPDDWTDEQVETRAFECGVEMMLIMLDHLYQRPLLMMDSFTMETIAQWHFERHCDVINYVSDQGKPVPRPKDLMMQGTLKNYTNQVKQMWKNQGQGRDNWRKIEFADQYDAVYPHWRRLARMITEREDNVGDYAKAGQFGDTPDDLIDRLWNIDRSSSETAKKNVSDLALEHAARRARLLKRSGAGESARKKREEGVSVSDYSSAQLFAFLKEGREAKLRVAENLKVQDRIATYPAPERESDATLQEKRKVLEEKIEFIRKNSPIPPEQNDG